MRQSALMRNQVVVYMTQFGWNVNNALFIPLFPYSWLLKSKFRTQLNGLSCVRTIICTKTPATATFFLPTRLHSIIGVPSRFHRLYEYTILLSFRKQYCFPVFRQSVHWSIWTSQWLLLFILSLNTLCYSTVWTNEVTVLYLINLHRKIK